MSDEAKRVLADLIDLSSSEIVAVAAFALRRVHREALQDFAHHLDPDTLRVACEACAKLIDAKENA